MTAIGGRRPALRATVAVVVGLLLGVTPVVAPSVGADVAGKRTPKPCPSALTKVKVPKFATPSVGAGTTTTTTPCRAVELDRDRAGKPQRASYLGVMSFGLSQQVPAGGQYADAVLDFALRDDGHGKLTGTLEGSQTQTLTLSNCPSSTTTSGSVKATLTGTRDASTMNLLAEGLQYTPPQVTPCPGGMPGLIGGIFVFPQTAPAFAGLKGNPARYRYHTRETVGAGAYPFTVEYTVLVVKLKQK